MNRAAIAVAVLASAVAAPAAGLSYVVTVSGQIAAAPSANPVPGLPFGSGSFAFASFRIDLDSAGRVDLAPAGGTGTSSLYPGTVRGGVIALSGPGGGALMTQSDTSLGALFVINDGSVVRPGQATLRTDQVSISDGLRFTPVPVPGYAVSGLAPDVQLRSLNFGKSQATTDPTVPGLLTSSNLPDFGAILAGPGPFFFSFTLLQGAPLSTAEAQRLPSSLFSVGNPFITVTAVPEPATWTLLVGGFGLVGVSFRARRAATSRTAV